MVIGNKLDLVKVDPSLRTVETTEAEDFAQYEGFEYMEISALTGKLVDEAFLKLLHQIHDSRVKPKNNKAGGT